MQLKNKQSKWLYFDYLKKKTLQGKCFSSRILLTKQNYQYNKKKSCTDSWNKQSNRISWISDLLR